MLAHLLLLPTRTALQSSEQNLWMSAAWCETQDKPNCELCRAYADSKTLSEDRREALMQDMAKNMHVAFLCDVLSASDISMNMLSRYGMKKEKLTIRKAFSILHVICRDRISLNSLANDSTFRLLDSVLGQGVNLQEVRLPAANTRSTCRSLSKCLVI